MWDKHFLSMGISNRGEFLDPSGAFFVAAALRLSHANRLAEHLSNRRLTRDRVDDPLGLAGITVPALAGALLLLFAVYRLARRCTGAICASPGARRGHHPLVLRGAAERACAGRRPDDRGARDRALVRTTGGASLEPEPWSGSRHCSATSRCSSCRVSSSRDTLLVSPGFFGLLLADAALMGAAQFCSRSSSWLFWICCCTGAHWRHTCSMRWRRCSDGCRRGAR